MPPKAKASSAKRGNRIPAGTAPSRQSPMRSRKAVASPLLPSSELEKKASFAIGHYLPPREKKETKGEDFTFLITSDPTLDRSLVGLRAMVGAVFGKRGFRTRLGLSLAFNTTASTGQINVVSNVSSVSAIAEWTSFTNLFDEFFVHSMTLKYEPVGQFIGPLGFNSSTQVVSTQLFWVQLYHGSATYAAATPADAMLNNATLHLSNSGRPTTFVWRNNENPATGTVTTSTTSSPPPTQSWCLTSNASVYTGQVQVQSYSGVGPSSGGVTFGNAARFWDVSFRARA